MKNQNTEFFLYDNKYDNNIKFNKEIDKFIENNEINSYYQGVNAYFDKKTKKWIIKSEVEIIYKN